MLPKLLVVLSHKNNKIAIYFGKTGLLYGRFCENPVDIHYSGHQPVTRRFTGSFHQAPGEICVRQKMKGISHHQSLFPWWISRSLYMREILQIQTSQASFT